VVDYTWEIMDAKYGIDPSRFESRRELSLVSWIVCIFKPGHVMATGITELLGIGGLVYWGGDQHDWLGFSTADWVLLFMYK